MKIIHDKTLANIIPKHYNCRIRTNEFENNKILHAYNSGSNIFIVTNGTTNEITILEEWFEYYIIDEKMA